MRRSNLCWTNSPEKCRTAFPSTSGCGWRVNEWVVRSISGTLYLLFGGVALLLAIGCGNVSILLLARGTARQHELAVRAAIGAGRGRLLRQLLTESMLLAAAGVVLGVMAAYGMLAGLRLVLP